MFATRKKPKHEYFKKGLIAKKQRTKNNFGEMNMNKLKSIKLQRTRINRTRFGKENMYNFEME
eukprot:snap_masked-scaffold_11-processed-gene-1.13-mRNA-1 protein AED:1.00 eAED:1.00 QI:0/-1/0/0/-1/1/1/0/62